MSQLTTITCMNCGSECEITFEIPMKHEVYWIDKNGIIQTGTNGEYDEKHVKQIFKMEEIDEIAADCEECGQSGAVIILEDGTVIADDELTNSTLWSLI